MAIALSKKVSTTEYLRRVRRSLTNGMCLDARDRATQLATSKRKFTRKQRDELHSISHAATQCLARRYNR